MNLQELRDNYKPQILAIAAKYGVENIRVFGSTARGDANENSDIDLLVNFSPKIRLQNLIDFDSDLKKLTGRTFDIVSDRALNGVSRKYVMKDLQEL